MARGLDKHTARKSAVAGLGRSLARRASNRCELCRDSTSLKVIEVGPVPEEPEPERAVMVCARCQLVLEGGRGHVKSMELRFLEEAVWSEVLPVQLSAVRHTRVLADQGVDWARDVVDGLWLSPEVEALV